MALMAKVLVRTAGLSRADWLAARRRGIGGSDAAIVAGCHPYQGAYALWLDKTGQQPLDPAETDAQALGRALEDAVARRAADRLGVRIRRRNAILAHPQFGWMIGDLDREIVGQPALMECKTINPQRWRREQETPSGLPLEWIVQTQHYLAVTGAAFAVLAIYVLGQGLEIRRVPADAEFQANLIRAEAAFWDLVQRRIPPQMDGLPATRDALIRAWVPVEGGPEPLPPETDALAARYLDLSAAIGRLEQERDTVGNLLRARLGPAVKGRTPTGYRITWRPVTRRQVDWAWLEGLPDYAAHVQQTATRRFQVLPPKEDAHA